MPIFRLRNQRQRNKVIHLKFHWLVAELGFGVLSMWVLTPYNTLPLIITALPFITSVALNESLDLSKTWLSHLFKINSFILIIIIIIFGYLIFKMKTVITILQSISLNISLFFVLPLGSNHKGQKSCSLFPLPIPDPINWQKVEHMIQKTHPEQPISLAIVVWSGVDTWLKSGQSSPFLEFFLLGTREGELQPLGSGETER